MVELTVGIKKIEDLIEVLIDIMPNLSLESRVLAEIRLDQTKAILNMLKRINESEDVKK